jgi:predicted dithiol-disulfide oxidoreductase (DUF899 family)
MPKTGTDELDKRINDLYSEIIEKKKELYQVLKQVPQVEMQDYEFHSRLGFVVKLSELFGDKDELIIVHNMGHTCPYCTLWADGFNGVVQHLENRAAFVVSTPDPPKVMRDFARNRNWTFNMVSTIHTTFKQDLGFETANGMYIPGVSTFRKDEEGRIFHVAKTFLGPGDDFCSVWYFFDLLPNATDWEPKFSYLNT